MRNYLLVFFGLLIGLTAWGQERYLDTVFQDITKSEDVQYGENITVLTVSVPGIERPTKKKLVMDIYEPAEDSAALRPLVLLCHTGNFLPYPTNGSTSGDRNSDMAIIEMSKRLAKMGYVAANMDYRLGWNPIAPTVEERTNTLINAAYRGVQDLRTAVRFFKKDVIENGNTYGIDTSRIVAWGEGTGGYISLNAAVLDNYTDILIPKFFSSSTTAEGQPIPMVIEQVHGDIYGTSVGINPLNGDTLSLPNHVGYNSDFQLTVNVGGAMGDTSWLDADDGPFISVHVPTDPNAPYKEFTLIVPTTGEQVVEVQGSYLVDSLATVYGNNQVFADLELDDSITMVAESRRGDIAGLLPLIGDTIVDSAPWQYWDKENNTNSANGLITNPTMSKEKANRYIDSIMMFYAPRAYAVLDLGALTAVENLKLETGLKVYPTLVVNEVTIKTDLDHPFEAIYLYDQQGRYMKSVRNIRTNQYTLDMTNMPAGLYFARILTKGGSSVSRIIKQ